MKDLNCLFWFMQLLGIIEMYVVSRGLIFRRIDGNTPANKRQYIVKEFNAEPSISLCLLSTLYVLNFRIKIFLILAVFLLIRNA